MRFHWLLLSLLSFLLLATPAQAGKLLFWRFESNLNRLIFTTDDGVQPTAQLIPNPTRIVIDLPGITLGQPSVTKPIGGTIKSIRIGQFDATTTRLVIELAPGYTVDPQQVKIRGLSPTQWTVELPTPYRVDSSLPNPKPVNTPAPSNTNRPPSTPRQTDISDFQVTRNGLFVRLERNGDDRKIRIKRSRDRQKIEFELPGATLPSSLVKQTLPVNNYGIGEIQFEQSSTEQARITLTVNKDSPDWQALYSRFGGLVLLPKGGLSSLESRTPPSPAVSPSPRSTPVVDRRATIQRVDLTGNGSQLTIRSDRPIQGTGYWNRNNSVYEIRIPNAQLAYPFPDPQLGSNSSIYQVRIRQEASNTVVILVQPAYGYQFGQLSQPNSQLLSLEVRPTRTPSNGSEGPTIIAVPPAPKTSPSPTPSPITRRTGKILVIIDPGHGGKDPGAIGIGGLQEKDVILPISLEVARILEAQGIQVMLTRSSDYFVSLEGRTALANRADADLFVSIHANSLGKGRPDVSGLEVYYYGNRALADTIHRNIIKSLDVRDRGVRRARFYVLRTSKMPATLVEVGFITGTEDYQKLRNPAYQRQMAAAIARGIIEYLQRYR